MCRYTDSKAAGQNDSLLLSTIVVNLLHYLAEVSTSRSDTTISEKYKDNFLQIHVNGRVILVKYQDSAGWRRLSRKNILQHVTDAAAALHELTRL